MNSAGRDENGLVSEAKKILVAGCGAIGSVFACLLAEAGHRVSAWGRGEHIRAVAADGIRVTGIWGEHACTRIHAVDSASALDRDYDAVLVTCKSIQTRPLLAELGDRLAPDRPAASGAAPRALSLQNGLGNIECLNAVFGPRRCLAARVIFGAVIERPGAVRVTVEAEPVLVGTAGGGKDSGAQYWAALFDAAGINCRASESVMAAIWGKIFYNAALNPMGALLGLSYGELVADGLRRTVMNRIMAEAYAVACAEGVELPWADAAEYQRLFYERLIPPTAEHRSSMLQDIEAGRPTEIDAICGEVVRRGEARGLDVTANRMLLALVTARSSKL